MSKKCDTVMGILQRKGTDQLLRNKFELDPASIELMDFDLEDWMKFAYNLANHVNYFNEESSKISDGDWQSFFKDNGDLKELLETLEETNSLTPHLTLFICFLRLMDFSKERFNQITKRHLDFFYTEILQIDKIPAQSDKAYLVFELAKSFDQEKLEKGLGLDGGKDGNGNKRIYELTEELAANKAQVAQMKNLYFHKKLVTDTDAGADYYMRSSSVANSYDGKGEAFPGEDVSWLPFGYYQNENIDEDKSLDYPALEKAKIGFSIGADILELSEGERHVQFSVDFKSAFTVANTIPTFQELTDSIEVYYTIKNKWEGPLKLLEESGVTDTELPSTIFKGDINQEDPKTIEEYGTKVHNNRAELYVKLETKDEPTAPYDPEIHLGNLTGNAPVFRFIIDVNSKSGKKVFQAFSKAITACAVQVEVQGMRDLVLDTDTGKLNPTKPGYPFTTNPVIGSNFIIDKDEIFNKNWSSVNVQIKWQNTPNDFDTWYTHYTGWKDPEAIQYVKKNNQWTYVEDSDGLPTSTKLFQGDQPVPDDDQSDDGDASGGVEVLEEVVEINYECLFDISNPVFSKSDEYAGPIKLSLKTSFLQDQYAILFSTAMMNNPPVDVPNKPYTPFSQEVVVNYIAKDVVKIASKTEVLSKATDAAETEGSYVNRAFTLFHERPFGHSIEHAYLRKLYEAQSPSCSLAPIVEHGGELYIGLENAKNLQTVSLFVQLLEGSENPLVDSFEDVGVEWEILCSDFWQPLDSIAIKMNEIDNFLKSGLVRFEIPKEATDDNMQLDKGLFWVKAVMPKSFDAVCRVLDISAQGAMAEFVNNDNELSHLATGLPAETIAKLEERLSSVKSVTQSFNSFDGKPEESDPAYYKRVSERIRHKNRAIMLWDYENIVLQEFPDIYRVKCLNHTNSKSLLAAGSVTLAVVPNTVDKNMYNILQPRVSKAYLNKIHKYVSQLTSLHVNLKVINPQYEEVKIDIKVKFFDQFDKSLYKIELNQDLKKFLSPWAFEDTKNVEFGVTLHQSVLIDFVEQLPYVDYITAIRMFVGPVGQVGTEMKDAKPSSPKSILVSKDEHIIEALPASAEPQSITVSEC